MFLPTTIAEFLYNAICSKCMIIIQISESEREHRSERERILEPASAVASYHPNRSQIWYLNMCYIASSFSLHEFGIGNKSNNNNVFMTLKLCAWVHADFLGLGESARPNVPPKSYLKTWVGGIRVPSVKRYVSASVSPRVSVASSKSLELYESISLRVSWRSC